MSASVLLSRPCYTKLVPTPFKFCLSIFECAETLPVMAQGLTEFNFNVEKTPPLPLYHKQATMGMSAPSSINSADVLNGRHGVMAKCKSSK